MDEMPEGIVQAFIKNFFRLPQRVIWQWQGKPRNYLPKNIRTVPWIPQQDLLGNNLLLFNLCGLKKENKVFFFLLVL